MNLLNKIKTILVGLQNTHDNISPSSTTSEFVKHSYSYVSWFTEHKWWYITFNNEELSHYLEEVISSEAWTCDSPRYETIADRDPPPTADDQEIHHSVPKATPKSLGQSNYKDNINIILSLNAFFGMTIVPSKPCM